MVTFQIEYLGELRCRAVHEFSGTELITDAPLDNQGLAQSFSPTDLVATALGVCMTTMMGIYARQQKIRLEGTSLHVEKHMSTDPPRRITRIAIDLLFPAGIDYKQRPALEKISRNCPVLKSIHPDIDVALTFAYPD